MEVQALSPRKRRVFESVFGLPDISFPTPHVTPLNNFVAQGQTWGGPLSSSSLDQKLHAAAQKDARGHTSSQPLFPRNDDHLDEQVRWDRAWHLVTHTLLIPEFKGEGLESQPLKPSKEQLDENFLSALELVLDPAKCLPRAKYTENVIVWYMAQVRRDFLRQILPIVQRLAGLYEGEELLGRGMKALEMGNRQYFHGLWVLAHGLERTTPGVVAREVVRNVSRDYHGIVGEAVLKLVGGALKEVLKSQLYKVLGLSVARSSNTSKVLGEGHETEQARKNTLGLVDALNNVGLANDKFQVILAEIMNDAITAYVDQGCKGVWTPNDTEVQASISNDRKASILPRTAHHNTPSRCITQLCEWIEDRFAKLAVQIFSVLKLEGIVSWADVEKYKEMAIGRLAELRINELFDIVVNWPRSSGGLDDLRTAITTPQRRLHLTEVFSKNLQARLLHPGTSTLQILQTYISMIWSFHALDHSKVLLDRVAYPLQVYLCSREDTVRIIISGLLSETHDDKGKPVKNSGENLVELAHLLKDGGSETAVNDEELDWHDMEWTPDPVDAGPGYKRSKDADVIGTLIGVLGSQEIFIKEFQTILGEYLIREQKERQFHREELVLNLLKSRFGEPPLQACEVMLKDIYDSTKLTSAIRQELNHDLQHPHPRLGSVPPSIDLADPALDTKILSRLFWPATVMDEEHFIVPEEISLRQRGYERIFMETKGKRKLNWLNALGQAEVELVLKDRVIKEECSTWVATVIYAFSRDDDQMVRKTVEQLVEELQMDEDMIVSALRFWTSKNVLHQPSPDSYSVLEVLPVHLNPTFSPLFNNPYLNPSLSPSASPSHSSSRQSTSQHPSSSSASTSTNSMLPPPPIKRAVEKGIPRDKDNIYWNFVKGMLTNTQKEMPVAQIGMMMKMMIEGFSYGNEDLKDWLNGRVESGELEVGGGGKFRLKK